MHHAERRRWVRARGVDETRITGCRIRPGHPAVVLDISAGGVLVETTRRLLPGAAIELQIERSDERVPVRGIVSRSAVSRLHASNVWYRAAVAFDTVVPGFPSSAIGGYSVLPHVSRGAAPFRVQVTPEIS